MFDFDHTIIDDNSDYIIHDLFPNKKLPNDMKFNHLKDCWTDFM